jgi:hypothetical protein
MKMKLRTVLYGVVRQDLITNKEWIDSSSFDLLPDKVEDKAIESNIKHSKWAGNNPIIRVVLLNITEGGIVKDLSDYFDSL